MPNYVIRLSENGLTQKPILDNLSSLIIDGKCVIVLSSPKHLLESIHTAAQILTDSRTDCDSIVTAIKSDIADLIKSYGFATNPAIETLVQRLEILLKGINYTGSLSPMIHDQILSYADKISAFVFSEYLRINNINNQYITPEELGLIVSEEYGNATILLAQSQQKLNTSILSNINVVPGSHGISLSGKTVRIGFQAADYTASALATLLQTDNLELWNINTPFKTADSKIIADVEFVNELSYAEASELAYFNSCASIHPRIVDPLLENNIPIKVYQLTSDGKKLMTTISSQENISPEVVKSVAHSDDIALLKLYGPGVGFKSGILAKVTTALHQNNVNIRSVITAQTSINFIIERQYIKAVKRIISDLDLLSICKFEIEDCVSLLAIIGHGMQSKHGVSSNLFAAMSDLEINVLLSGSGASDLVSYIVVKESDSEKAITEIHKTFFKSNI
ncbi:MAG: ACT domain-containing protein [Mangrovibacterium sp.]